VTKKIVVCTIQTFPFALQAVRELAATQGKRFAVIADEAHSSQTGEAASKLKMVLSLEEQKELEDGGAISTEEIYGTDTTDGDQLSHATTLNEKVLESTVLQKQASSNSKE
jgi:type I restriction enzyme R subunit